MSVATILIADDDRSIRTVLTQALTRHDYTVRATGNASTLWHWVSEGHGDLVITDVILPDENGLNLIPRIHRIRPELRIIAMSAKNTLMTAVQATEKGAYDYLPKPFDLDDLTTIVDRALSEKKHRADVIKTSEEEADLPLIGRSAAMQDLYKVLARLMHSDLTVLIVGESGTGKELVARALHSLGHRADGPFVPINVASVPEGMIPQELFGFMDAAGVLHPGKFEAAQNGTLYLDEIGDMPMETQTRLLRVLQDGEFTPVGSTESIRADVRIVASTHKDLRTQIHQGQFREDLFYRLNVVPVRLPPLRDRVEDITDLVEHFLEKAARDGLPSKAIEPAAIDRLHRHSWPGNVRELENLVRRLCTLITTNVIDAKSVDSVLREGDVASEAVAIAMMGEGLSGAIERHLRGYFAAHDGELPPSGLYDRLLCEFEKPLITVCLDATGGNQIKAAELLGLNRNTLRKKIRMLGIEVLRSAK